jgi:hypothetical protein
MEIITAKIDVTKIEKERLFPGKNGAKYLDVVLIPTANDRFGNSHMVVQAVSKEERQAGVKGPILGNAKSLGGARRSQDEEGGQRISKPAAVKPKEFDADEDVPF